MNDDQSPRGDVPLTDELLSAVLDGDATPAERALVEGSDEGRRRLAALRAATEAVARPVPPLPAVTVDALVDRAVRIGSAPNAATSSVGADPVGTRRHRQGRSRWSGLAGAVAAAAAVVVLIAGIAALAQRSGSSSDSASSGADTAAESSAPTADDSAGETSLNGLAPPDLGSLDDAEAVLDRYGALVTPEPSIDHQFDEASTAAATAPPLECPLPPVPSPEESWSVVAVASLPSGPVVVLGNAPAAAASRVVVVDATTCAVLAERAI